MRGVKLPGLLRTLLASLLLGAPFALVALQTSSWVGPLTQASVGLLLELTAPLAAPSPVALPPEAEARLDAPLPLVFEAATKPARKGIKRASDAKPAALFVSEAAVLRLAQSGARPRGVLVAATEQHPAGLRLSAVAGLGIGLQDGDILIEALGFPPRSAEQIIGAILEARAKQVRFLSGTLWRRGQTFRITVEQPYLPVPA
jgi:hypothetical protein